MFILVTFFSSSDILLQLRRMDSLQVLVLIRACSEGDWKIRNAGISYFVREGDLISTSWS